MSETYNPMTGEWNKDKPFDSASDHPFPSPATGEQFSPPTVQQEQPKEASVQEHSNMIRELFEKVVNKAVEATDLAKRVKELEQQVAALQTDLTHSMQDAVAERNAHAETKRQLQEVQSQLAQRENTVHDLVMERDIVVGERNQAQQERNDARQEVERIRQELRDTAADLDRERERAHILEERNNALASRINALKEAFGALQGA